MKYVSIKKQKSMQTVAMSKEII